MFCVHITNHQVDVGGEDAQHMVGAGSGEEDKGNVGAALDPGLVLEAGASGDNNRKGMDTEGNDQVAEVGGMVLLDRADLVGGPLGHVACDLDP